MHAPAPTPLPRDADDTRAAHLRTLIRQPVALSLTATGAIVGVTIGAVAAGVTVGAVIAAAIVVAAGVIAFVLASDRAESDFFAVYAAERGLNQIARRSLPPLTPLLRNGDERRAEHVMKGTLPGGIAGTLAHYTYVDVTSGSRSERRESEHPFTVVIGNVPESAPLVGELYCQRRFGFRLLDSVEDAFRTRDRVELESEALDRTYEIFADRGTDENWLRQLFSPTFILWLTESAPREFAFELVAGLLCVSVTGHLESAAELDRLCESAVTVAARLSEESRE
jgi:hypothetical protein